ncbi:MAG: alanine racemase [Pyrinomonadaceae bacterium]|nr:alanine racemase [Pyrinomonadaceae bacterium]
MSRSKSGYFRSLVLPALIANVSDSTHDKSPLDTIGCRPTWAEIDLDALAANFLAIKNRVGPGVRVMAVVKANAYGHGSVYCARRLAKEGADWFGVALPEEGIGLRVSGITQPILCLAGFWDGQAAACIQERLVPVVYRLDLIEALDSAARDAGMVADVHVKIDTGMGRLGVRFDEAVEFADALKRFEHIRVDGLMTHFAAADDPTCETLTDDQMKRFENVATLFRAHGFAPRYLHSANSAGIFSHPEAPGNMVRPGGVLYGIWRDILPASTENNGLRPVMSVHSRIILLKWVPKGETIGYGCTFEASRKSLVATVPIGYDDGYLRGLSNRSHVIVRGTFAPVVGRISMDLTILDVTSVDGVELGDPVTLLGRDGDLEIPAEELARIAGTFSYEVTCGIGARVPRVYSSK